MLNRYFYIVLLFLSANSLQAQNVEAMPVEEISAIREADLKRTDIIEFAKTYLGTTYVYASQEPSKGFDCSGFTYYVFKHFNINLPRGSSQFKSLGTAQKPEEFEVGDILVFYGYRNSKQIGHVGIICEADGMKSKFIHASSGKAFGVTISQLDSEQYTRRFYKCIDVIDL